MKVPRSQIILFEVQHNARNTKITILFCCKTCGWSKFQIGFKSQPMMTSLRFGIEIACIPTGRLKLHWNFDFSIHTTIRNFDSSDFIGWNAHIKCYYNFFENRIASRRIVCAGLKENMTKYLFSVLRDQMLIILVYGPF